MALSPVNIPPKKSGGKGGIFGKIAGGIAGAIVGTVAGNPVAGASIGSKLGGAVGGAVDPAKANQPAGVPTLERAALQDPTVQIGLIDSASKAIREDPAVTHEDAISLTNSLADVQRKIREKYGLT